mmetsp:Transcript_4336/g.8244  ORF Transcript_4336/g.8244 Transcript_4336/m.8244 type:complete len:213 (-) Transcript_4336:1680-2318(-)
MQRPDRNENVLARQDADGVALHVLAGGAYFDVIAQFTSPDQQRRFRVEPQGLHERVQQQGHLGKILELRPPAPEHLIDLLLDLLEVAQVLGLLQLVQGPSQHGCCGFVASDEKGHEIVAKLPVCHVLVLRDHKVLQEGKSVFLRILRLLHGFPDELVQHRIEKGQMLTMRLLVPENTRCSREVPVRNDRLRSALRFSQHGVRGTDHGRLALD